MKINRGTLKQKPWTCRSASIAERFVAQPIILVDESRLLEAAGEAAEVATSTLLHSAYSRITMDTMALQPSKLQDSQGIDSFYILHPPLIVICTLAWIVTPRLVPPRT